MPLTRSPQPADSTWPRLGESDAQDARLIEHLWSDFPLIDRPFAAVAAALGLSEEELLERVRHLLAHGQLRRLGPVFCIEAAPARLLLVAVATDGDDRDQVDDLAARLRLLPEVTLVRRRAHRFGLWLLLAAAPGSAQDGAVQRIRNTVAGREVLVLACEQRYGTLSSADFEPPALPLERRLLRAVASGLPLVTRPYEALAAMLGSHASAVQEAMRVWLAEGLVQRVGVLPAQARQMRSVFFTTLWAVQEARLDALAEGVAALPAVVHACRRTRHGRPWPYNLWLTLAGQSVAELEATRSRIAALLGLACESSATLVAPLPRR